MAVKQTARAKTPGVKRPKKSVVRRAATKKDDPTTDMLSSIHKTMAGLRGVGLVDKQTMQDFDDMCLPPVKNLTAADIKALREQLNLSQPVFAKYLNTTKSTVSKWEQGDKKPNGIAQRLLNVISSKGLEVLV